MLLIITVAEQAGYNGKRSDNQKEKITVDHVLILFPRIVPRLDAGTPSRGVNARTQDFVPTHGPAEAQIADGSSASALPMLAQERFNPLQCPQNILGRIGVGEADKAFAVDAEIRAANGCDAGFLEQGRGERFCLPAGF